MGDRIELFFIGLMLDMHNALLPLLTEFLFSWMARLGFLILLWCFLPWQMNSEHSALTRLCVFIYKVDILLFALGVCAFLIDWMLYHYLYAESTTLFRFIGTSFKGQWWWFILTAATGFLIAFVYTRYVIPWFSGLFHRLWRTQPGDHHSDIRNEQNASIPVISNSQNTTAIRLSPSELKKKENPSGFLSIPSVKPICKSSDPHSAARAY